MLKSFPYDRAAAVRYARRWALSRNPAYLNFETIGGDCTNFISQCVYAGAGVMNYTKDTGWYYRSAGDRAAAWTGVEFLHRFLTGNKAQGPVGETAAVTAVQPGDIAQLRFPGMPRFSHSLLITETGAVPAVGSILICTHTDDALDRPLMSYMYEQVRFIHIREVLKNI